MSRRGKWRNEQIRTETGMGDAMGKSTMLKLKWAEHVARIRPEKWSKRAIERTPWERRGMRGMRGRPRRRWRDELM